MNNLEKLLFGELMNYYTYKDNKILATEKLKTLPDMEFNIHCKYVMEKYNKIITATNLENLTAEEKILEDYVQLLNIENLKRNFK